MQFRVACIQCLQESDPSQMPDPFQYQIWLDVTESGYFEALCSHGRHKLVGHVGTPKFGLLFEEGICCLRDGYHRAAILNFAAGLERFYEFAFWVFSGKNQIAVDQIKATWRDVRNMSERQLGLYIGSYITAFGSKPDLLTQDEVSFRNKVVHQGMAVGYEEALGFGQRVADLICQTQTKMALNHQENVYDAWLYIVAQAIDPRIKPGLRAMITPLSTFLGVMGGPQAAHFRMYVENRFEGGRQLRGGGFKHRDNPEGN